MNHRWRILSVWLMTAVVAGCGQSRPFDDRTQSVDSGRQLDEVTIDDGLDPNEKRTVALVSWLKHQGVTLEYKKSAEGSGGWWRVAKPKTSDDYDVVFLISSFPTWASHKQMCEALNVNLAYQLNAPARLAMSYGGISGSHPDAKLPKSDDELPQVNGLPVTKAVEQLFMQYMGDY